MNFHLYIFHSVTTSVESLASFSQNDFNPLTPMSDQDRISPYNINTISTRQVMRIKKNIILGIISWSNTKFAELTL